MVQTDTAMSISLVILDFSQDTPWQVIQKSLIVFLIKRVFGVASELVATHLCLAAGVNTNLCPSAQIQTQQFRMTPAGPFLSFLP